MAILNSLYSKRIVEEAPWLRRKFGWADYKEKEFALSGWSWHVVKTRIYSVSRIKAFELHNWPRTKGRKRTAG